MKRKPLDLLRTPRVRTIPLKTLSKKRLGKLLEDRVSLEEYFGGRNVTFKENGYIFYGESLKKKLRKTLEIPHKYVLHHVYDVIGKQFLGEDKKREIMQDVTRGFIILGKNCPNRFAPSTNLETGAFKADELISLWRNLVDYNLENPPFRAMAGMLVIPEKPRKKENFLVIKAENH